MTINEIKNRTAVLFGADLTRLIADSWILAQSALCAIPDTDYRETPVAQYPLQLLCLMLWSRDGFHEHNSAEKERLVEKLKAVLKPVAALLNYEAAIATPTYSLVSALTPKDGERSFFSDQLKEDFKRLDQDAADALATALYAVVYACYGDFENGVIAFALRQLVDDPFDIGNFARMTNDEQLGALNEATKKVYGAPQTNASPSYSASPSSGSSGSAYRPRKAPGRWMPLKVYLIITTLFVALVFGLVFWSMSSGEGASAMSIMDANGQMIAIEPGMEPATLFLFGTVDYDGLIAGIKTAVIIFIIWRVALTTAVYIFNARRRRRYRP